MPRQRSTGNTPNDTNNPWAGLRVPGHITEAQFAEAMAPYFLDMLFKTPKTKTQAKKNLDLLWDLIRENPKLRVAFGWTLARGPGRNKGSALVKDATEKEWYLVLAVRSGIRPSDVLHHLCKEQQLEPHRYEWLDRRVEALGSALPDAATETYEHFKRMDYKTRLDFFKVFFKVKFESPA